MNDPQQMPRVVILRGQQQMPRSISCCFTWATTNATSCYFTWATTNSTSYCRHAAINVDQKNLVKSKGVGLGVSGS